MLRMDMVKSEKSFGSVIRTNVALLRFSGIISLEEKTIPKIILSHCLTFVSVILLTIQTFAYTYVFAINSSYVETIIESFALVLALFGGLVRFIISYNSRDKIREILNKMEKLWDTMNAEERRSIDRSIKSTKNLTYFFISQCICTIFFYAIAPLVVNSPTYKENTTRILPYAFFTEVERSPYYEILYFFQLTSMLNLSFTCVGVEMIGPLLITMVCGHLRVLQNRFQQLGSQMKVRKTNAIFESSHCQVYGNTLEASKDPGAEIWDVNSLDSSLISSKFRSYVKYHKTILAICTDLEQLTNIIFLTQLIGSTYVLSAVGFKLCGNDQDKYKYTSQLVLGIIQLFICNWPPDVLMTESRAIGDAAYHADWCQWPTELKKSVHIVVLRAQKPIQLKAGKFINLSLETFASMVSSAVSFFTVLKSLN